nr:efflux RND transporter periplasmic adaptor subunit [uncultured Blautia sp.]
MSKVKKVIIGVIITALVGTGIGGGLMYVRKGNQKEVLVASVSDLAGERYDSDTTLSGNVYANATQRISVDKDMIIEEVYVSKGDEVKPGDKLISFDMTLVEMELNIARLKLQKQQQDLATAKKRLTSLQNGGPILDSEDSSADDLIDSDSDSDSSTDTGLDSGDDEMASVNVTASDHYLAAVLQPMLLTALTGGFSDSQDGDEVTGTEDMTGSDELSDGTDDTDASEENNADSGTASDFYGNSSNDGFSSEASDSGQGGFISGGISDGSLSGADTTLGGNNGFVDGEEPFYLTLDFDTEPYQGNGTKDDPYLYLCSSAKGKVNVTGAFLNKMAGYNADGTILLHPGGYWYLLEFHQNDAIADYTNRKQSCTGYYLIDGNMLSNPVDRFAEMDFTLEGALQYDNGDEEPDIPDDPGTGGSGGGASLSRAEAIKIQKKRIASLELDIQESEISISKLQKKADRQLITSKLDGIVTTVGDAATGTNSESDAFMLIKSKDGYYVQGTVGELMLDQVKEGTVLTCNCYGENGYLVFDAEVVQVSDYAVEGDSSYYYGDSNPNVSSYTFTAKITDDSVQVSVGDWVDIQLEQNQSTDGIVLSKAFVRTEDGVSYVYKDDNGVLKKQIVKVKENVNGGTYVLVSAGLSMDDKIAFPYSKSVKEGMKTKEGSLDEFMGYDSTSYGGLG